MLTSMLMTMLTQEEGGKQIHDVVSIFSWLFIKFQREKYVK